MFSLKKKVLIIGGAGYLGGAIVKLLLAWGRNYNFK